MTKKLIVNLPEDEHKKVVESAQKDKRKLSGFARKALENYIEEFHKKEETHK